MDVNKFNDILEKRIEKIKSSLGTKAKEYARNNDRLSNFKRAAQLQKCSEERAMLGTWSKQVISLTDMILDLENGTQHPRSLWDEKITDVINYPILLEAILEENNICKPK